MSTTHNELEAHGFRALTEYLDAEGVAFETVEHRPTDTAAAEARVSAVPADHTAKTVVVRDGAKTIIALVPASRRLDLLKLTEVLGVAGPLRLASETEIAEAFPRADVGAVPPVSALTAAEVVDQRLLEPARILCHGGDHTHGVLVAPGDVVRLADAAVADIVQDWTDVI